MTAMTTHYFNCPEHGPYETTAPTRVVNHWCPECSMHHRNVCDEVDAGYRRECVMYEQWERSGLPEMGRTRTLNNWFPRGKAQQIAHSAVSSYLAAPDDRVSSGIGLLLLGSPGVGKSHLLYAAVTEFVRAGHRATYAIWHDVLRRHKSSFGGSRDNADSDLMNQLATVPVLALDELAVQPGSNFDRSLLLELIDARYREKRVTLAASNAMVDTLVEIGERTADRLRECTEFIVIPGSSRRLESANNHDLIYAPPAIPEPARKPIEIVVTINGQREAIAAGQSPAEGEVKVRQSQLATACHPLFPRSRNEQLGLSGLASCGETARTIHAAVAATEH